MKLDANTSTLLLNAAYLVLAADPSNIIQHIYNHLSLYLFLTRHNPYIISFYKYPIRLHLLFVTLTPRKL